LYTTGESSGGGHHQIAPNFVEDQGNQSIVFLR
jgi:hypothetical protein